MVLARQRLSTLRLVMPGVIAAVQLYGEVPRREAMFYSGADLESYITEYISVYEDKWQHIPVRSGWETQG